MPLPTTSVARISRQRVVVDGELQRLQPLDLVAEARGLLEFEIGGGVAHLLLEVGQRVEVLFARQVAALFAAPVLRLVYGPSFVRAAPALLWVSVGLIPILSNSGRKVFLYASGGEALVVRWSAAALLVQVCLGAVLIPTLGSVGAAVSVAAGEAIIWWPLRRATPRSTTVNAELAEPAEHAEILSHLRSTTCA